MFSTNTTVDELLAEFRRLRMRLEEAEATLRRIGDGDGDGRLPVKPEAEPSRCSRQQQDEEFRAAESLAFSVIDQAGEVIIVCDERGVIIRASRLAHQLCGQDPLLKSFDELIRLRVTETGEKVSILPYAPSHLKGVEVECRHHDRTISYHLLNVSPLRGGREQIIGFVLTLTDITERRKFKEQLIAMNRELERRMEQRTRELQETQLQYLHAEKLSAIGQLAASIAHEFNNPLQGIMAILKGLQLTAIMGDEDRALLAAAISENRTHEESGP